MFPRILTFVFVLALVVTGAFAQETTGGLQGNVKDPTGALVSNAKVELTGTSLVGKKEASTDSAGYYRFANLPPGTYAISVKAAGFSELKREGIVIEVGHLPSLDLTLTVGAAGTVVEVTGAAPLIDVTTETTQTNITSDVLDDVPHEGRSFQSVIQFAPSASNEPLMGNNRTSNGTGSVSPGNGSNGNAYGYSVAGGSDSENSYLVEGQSTANIIGGYSHTNVPFDFIQEVQVKSSGIDAEHGGALGGVVNVVMKKGQNQIHGSVFAQFENQALDGGQAVYQRYDPTSSPGTPPAFNDAVEQQVQPIKPKTSDVFPGFTLGGPILKDKLFFFIGLNPEWNDIERKVNYGPINGGLLAFSQNTQTYYNSARLDYALTQKVRLFGSWLYQYQRQAGENLPTSDIVGNLFNPSTGCYGSAGSGDPTSPYYCPVGGGTPPSAYAHTLGYAAPNITFNTGADWTITPRLVSTTRFGYYFENYHDFGFPTGGNLYAWQNNSLGGVDTTGAPLPAELQQSTGYINAALDSNLTTRNANKAVQFDEDFAWFKSAWHGTHNFKFGYQLNRLSNNILQGFNEPFTQIFAGYAGSSTAYSPATPTGTANCAALLATQQEAGVAPPDGLCQGQFGVATVYDFGTGGKATSYNHGFFAQDAWTVGHGVTLNLGLRVEREYVPGEGPSGPGVPSQPINFSWSDKIAPRIGAAWDVFKDGRMKVFGSYGVFNDIMKLNVAISSFGGQYWQNCAYAINTGTLSDITPAFNSAGRDCVGPSASSEANFAAGGGTGLTFLENQNLRAFPTTCSTCSSSQEGVMPGLKPYRQHESTFGLDYQLSKGLALEARWDRRRLDHAIEDSSVFNAATGSETFVIVNPGQGVNSTLLGYCNFIYGAEAPSACVSSSGLYPPNKTIPAARSYDGFEMRLTKTSSHHWFGMLSYTYSHFRGNYTGLTSSDMSDGGLGGRNSPNNSRAFDEPYFSWNDNGGSSSGLLPTDRPNKFKGYTYYELAEGKHTSTDFGLFQYFYQGSPVSSYVDAGYSYSGVGSGGWDVYPVGRGKWVDVSQDPTTGAFTVGNPYTRRTPWYIQSDFNLTQNYKLGESKVVSFTATFTNLFNQHSVTAYNEQIDSGAEAQFLAPGGNFIINGISWYAAAMTPWASAGPAGNLQSQLNTPFIFSGAPLALSSQYGQPQFYQLSRNIRLGVKFTF
jgi:hypothetical protein